MKWNVIAISTPEGVSGIVTPPSSRVSQTITSVFTALLASPHWDLTGVIHLRDSSAFLRSFEELWYDPSQAVQSLCYPKRMPCRHLYRLMVAERRHFCGFSGKKHGAGTRFFAINPKWVTALVERQSFGCSNAKFRSKIDTNFVVLTKSLTVCTYHGNVQNSCAHEISNFFPSIQNVERQS